LAAVLNLQLAPALVADGEAAVDGPALVLDEDAALGGRRVEGHRLSGEELDALVAEVGIAGGGELGALLDLECPGAAVADVQVALDGPARAVFEVDGAVAAQEAQPPIRLL